MRVEVDRLRARERRLVAIQMSPARLHHADVRIREPGDHSLQQVRRRHEVGVENRDELGRRQLDAPGERARLVALPFVPANVIDRYAREPMSSDTLLDDRRGFIVRVVEHLNVELPRVT